MSKSRRLSFLAVWLVVALCISACNKKSKSELVWSKDLSLIGSQSSPRAVDLTGDGILDIVMGAGKNEYQPSPMGILAFDGKNGEVLWKQSAVDQVYGSATFYDATGDGVPDIYIGGRSPYFRALNGKDGSILWEYKFQYEEHPILRYAKFNFNNSVLVPDQNNDGLMDILTVNGGNSKAEPYSEVNRNPAVLMIFDAKNGTIIAADTMPDGKESYMSPLCFQQKGEQDYTLIFGTGGETIDGNLFIGKLSDLRNNKISASTIVASEKGHGFVAPPSAVDLNGDGILEIVAISHASTIVAVDGKTKRQLWSQSVPDTESSNSLAVGYFNDDSTPDLFTFVSKGQWPNSTGSVEIMINGKDGSIGYTENIGCTGYSSPVVFDINHDGIDEAIISVNEFDCSLGFTGKTPEKMENKLIAIDFSSHRVITLDQSNGFKNIFSTPWLGDLDDDGYLDIVHCQYYHHGDLLLFLGMKIKRIDTPIKLSKPVMWGSYMGSSYDGCFRDRL